ncbi:MAG: hypothetical protein IT167_18970 [Bryobacterales bacterium]|nr:hypothetical protein [Bryobacterales bacterium]
MRSFFIPKLTGTHADVLAAIGLADFLSPLDPRSTVVDLGHSFQINLSSALSQESIEALDPSPGYKYLLPKSTDKIPPSLRNDLLLDYQEQKEKANRQREREQAKRAGAELAEEAVADAPVNDFRLYQVLNTLQGDGATNKMILTVLQESSWAETVWTALECLANGEPPRVDWESDLVQLFNPQAAKGYARLKPDSTARGDKTKDAWAEPFTEWLRFRGFFCAAAPFFLGSKSENIRILTPLPKSISYRRLASAVSDLRQARIFGSAPKIDTLGVLKLAEILISSSPAAELAPPKALVDGVVITHYQSMGNAKTVTSTETLALPGWFELNTANDAEVWLSILDEHARVLRNLEDRNSDELGMLIQYRRFLEHGSSHGIYELLVFLETYGIFLIRKRAQDSRWRHRQFSLNLLEKILMPHSDYLAILQNPGFRALASAIRSATVSAQTLKRNKSRDYREIRYDVLPDLRRKRLLPDTAPFLEAIADFVATYNAESARRLEQNKPTGIRRVTTEDLQAFVALFQDRKDASLIGALLCAYATCRESSEPDTPSQDNTTQPEE